MINVLGDALAAGIMAHICRKDFAQDMGTEVRVVPFQEASKNVVLNLCMVTPVRSNDPFIGVTLSDTLHVIYLHHYL